MKTNMRYPVTFFFLLISLTLSTAQEMMHVKGKNLYDPHGEQVVLRGVNEMFIWSDNPTGEKILPEIAKTGSNVVRIVWMPLKDNETATPENLDKVITNCISNNMFPMPELHGATGKWDKLQEQVDYWTDPAVVNVLKKHEPYLLLNIANEVGDHNIKAKEFQAGYQKAIDRIRATGLKCPLIIDASGWGQDLNILLETGPSLIEHDPEHNLMLSVHMWWVADDGSTDRIKEGIVKAVSMDLPLLIGEFAPMGVGCKRSIDYRTIMAEAQKHQVGWLSWSWGHARNGDCSEMDMTAGENRGKYEGLHDWGKEVALTDPNSIANTSTKTKYLLQVKPGGEVAEKTDQELWKKQIENVRKGALIIHATPGEEVHVKQLNHEFWFGAAISNSIFDGSASQDDVEQYKKVFLENFNSAVTENAVKWGNMERKKGEVNYTVVDGMLEWTEENNIPLRGHNIFWGIPKFVQPWVKDLSEEELEKTLKNRAETLTAKYKGRFAEYDLNNEMIHGNYYEDQLGPNITKKMAEWAQNGDPDIELYLNDYDILTGNKLPEYMAHIRELLANDVPIAGIGVQGHLHGKSFDRKELKRSLDSLAIFGLPVKITEFNMPGQRSEYYQNRNKEMTAADEAQKAADIVDYYSICFAHPAVEGILMWGFWEGANWIPASSLYNRDWSPTPSALAYQKLIHEDWWTDETGKAKQDGEYTLPAFYGAYEITVDGETKKVSLTKEAGWAEVEF